jgi:hypothetical protein
VYRDMIVRLIRLWAGTWLIVSNPHLQREECTWFSSECKTRRRIAERVVVRFSRAIGDLLHGIFGAGPVWTPTIHSVVHDVPFEFSVLHRDLWFGNEQSIESMQAVCRLVLHRVSKTSQVKNTDMMIDNLMRQMAKLQLISSYVRQRISLKRQYRHAAQRWEYVQGAIAALLDHENMHGGAAHFNDTERCHPCGPNPMLAFRKCLHECSWRSKVYSLLDLHVHLAGCDLKTVSASTSAADGAASSKEPAAKKAKTKKSPEETRVAGGDAATGMRAATSAAVGNVPAAKSPPVPAPNRGQKRALGPDLVDGHPANKTQQEVETILGTGTEATGDDSDGEAELGGQESWDPTSVDEQFAEDTRDTPHDAHDPIDEHSGEEMSAEETDSDEEAPVLVYDYIAEHNIVGYVFSDLTVREELDAQDLYLRDDQTLLWSVGDPVEVLYEHKLDGQIHKREWIWAVVTGVTPSQTGEVSKTAYEVRYSDDDEQAGVVANRVRARPARVRHGRGVVDKTLQAVEDVEDRRHYLSQSERSGQLNKTMLSLGLVVAVEADRVCVAPLCLVAEEPDHYRVVPKLPREWVPRTALVAGMRLNAVDGFIRRGRGRAVAPFVVFELTLNRVAGYQELADMRRGE